MLMLYFSLSTLFNLRMGKVFAIDTSKENMYNDIY